MDVSIQYVLLVISHYNDSRVDVKMYIVVGYVCPQKILMHAHNKVVLQFWIILTNKYYYNITIITNIQL